MDFNLKPNLNRSFSAPDISENQNFQPIYRRLYVQEYYSASNAHNPIIRQISCDQLLHFDNNTIQTTNERLIKVPFLPLTDINTINKSAIPKISDIELNNTTFTPSVSRIDQLNISPMDVDYDESPIKSPTITSTPSEVFDKNETKIKQEPGEIIRRRFSYGRDKMENQNTPKIENCKVVYRGRLPMLKKEEEVETIVGSSSTAHPHRRFRKYTKYAKYASIATIIGLLFLIPYYDKYYYNRIIDSNLIDYELRSKLINQNEPIEIITNAVNLLNYNVRISVLNLVGTTGVGKTYAANIIKHNFKPSQTFDIDLNKYNVNNLNMMRNLPYLIVLDNLKIDEIENVLGLIDALPKDKAILLVNIFNIQEMVDRINYEIREEYVDEIYRKFKEFGCKFQNARFNRINKEIIREHLNRARNDDLQLDYKYIESLIEDHDFDMFGFKGFIAKLVLTPNGKQLFP